MNSIKPMDHIELAQENIRLLHYQKKLVMRKKYNCETDFLEIKDDLEYLEGINSVIRTWRRVLCDHLRLKNKFSAKLYRLDNEKQIE